MTRAIRHRSLANPIQLASIGFADTYCLWQYTHRYSILSTTSANRHSPDSALHSAYNAAKGHLCAKYCTKCAQYCAKRAFLRTPLYHIFRSLSSTFLKFSRKALDKSRHMCYNALVTQFHILLPLGKPYLGKRCSLSFIYILKGNGIV